MTDADILKIVAQLVAILAGVAGAVWRFSVALRGFESRVGDQIKDMGSALQVLGLRLEHSAEAQGATAREVEAVRRDVSEQRDRVTRLEEQVRSARKGDAR